MKTVLTALLLMVSGSALALDSCYTGAWGDNALDGEGITIEVMDSRVAVFFYRPGTDNQRWYLFAGDNSDSDTVELHSYVALRIGEVRNNGRGSVTAVDANTITFEYDFKFDFTKLDDPNTTIPWCIGCSESFTMTRITTPVPCE